ncbi:MAG TPA: 16S rRNA (adenine(1518)-N(6)/adenine(1519)-N(6))-dimethyltransferase RsmA [Bacillota bacterium]|nr:16S rRNA (adenine(1518)-N(6)/adenine(1519)-N(6))-dimethyltransferase RsmA [Bacillota bacterium]
MSQYGLKPQKGLGQNFLIDRNIVQKIVAAAAVEPGEAVLEIGPGIGALTAELARGDGQILALELDQGLARLLEEVLRPFTRVTVISGDALKADFLALANKYFPPGTPVKLVSNLPYYISSTLMYRIFEQKFPFARAVLMFQKEVAQRLLAEPGEAGYGSLSVLCRYYSSGTFLFNVSKQVFWPRPEVDSAVIMLVPRPPVLSPDEEALLWRIVKGSFQQRRKTLLNSLSKIFPWDKEILSTLLAQAAIKPATRPELLSIDQFAKLTRILYNYKRGNNRF